MTKPKTVFAAAILVIVVVTAISGAAFAQTLSSPAATSSRSIYERLPGQPSRGFSTGPGYPLLSGDPLGMCPQNRYATQPTIGIRGMMR